MSTYTQILYQIVFTTKNQNKTLIENQREILYKYIWGVLENKKCHLYRIGGIEDHLHIITHIHPTVALADLIKDIKLSTGKMLIRDNIFPQFEGWQEGYGAFTYSISAKNNLINYVKNQIENHNKVSLKEEYF